MLSFDLPPATEQVHGLSFTIGGASELVGLRVCKTPQPVAGSSPTQTTDGLFDGPCRRVHIAFADAVPAGTRVAGWVEVLLSSEIRENWAPLSVSPLFDLPKDITPATPARADHPYAGLLQLTQHMGRIGGQENGLDSSGVYKSYGWRLPSTGSQQKTLSLEGAKASELEFVDVLTPGTTAVSLRIHGFSLRRVSILCSDFLVARAAAPVSLSHHPGTLPGLARVVTSDSGFAELSVAFDKPVSEGGANVLRLVIEPLDDKAPLEGSVEFAYEISGGK